MDFDNEDKQEESETGSDELLSDDNLRLPDSANALVRLHAIRAWLARRQKETRLQIGAMALDLQRLQQEDVGRHEAPDRDKPYKPLRRRELLAREERVQAAYKRFQATQELLSVYEEAGGLLEDCVSHTTVSERLLVEFYLTIEQLTQEVVQEGDGGESSPRFLALNDVLQRVEQVGAPHEED